MKIHFQALAENTKIHTVQENQHLVINLHAEDMHRRDPAVLRGLSEQEEAMPVPEKVEYVWLRTTVRRAVRFEAGEWFVNRVHEKMSGHRTGTKQTLMYPQSREHCPIWQLGR